MKFKTNSSEQVLDINITPLIDIVFLLLIFFMVSTNFNKFTQINLTLPQVTKEYNQVQNDVINLKIMASGNYYVNDMPVNGTDKKVLMAAIRNFMSDDQSLIISGDSKAPHQAIVTALDAAGELGIDKIKLAAVKS